MSKLKAIVSNRLIMPERVIDGGVVLVDGQSILAAGRKENIAIPDQAEVFDYGDQYVSPGFIDIHTHGCRNTYAEDCPEGALEMSDYFATAGVSSFLPTCMKMGSTRNAIQAMHQQKQQGIRGAEIAGVHMEGPFLTPKGIAGSGAMDDGIVPPSMEALEEILRDGEGQIRIMAVSIDQPGVFDIIRELRAQGIVASCAHTRASYDDFMRSVEAGINHVTHLFNVMSGVHHRNPGIAGGGLTTDEVTSELICDGIHLHPAIIDLAIRAKGSDRLAIITDMATGGMEDGEYGDVVVISGIAYMKGADPNADSSMAGASKSLNVGVRNVVKAGYTMQTAVKMASITPARIVGLDKSKGSLDAGKDADIAVFDDEVNIKATMVKGQFVYTA